MGCLNRMVNLPRILLSRKSGVYPVLGVLEDMMNTRLTIGIACLVLSALPAYAQMAEAAGPVAMQEPVLDPEGQVIPYDGKKPVAQTPAPPARKSAVKKSTKKKSSKKPAKKKSAAK